MGRRGSIEMELDEDIVATLGEMAKKSGTDSIFEEIRLSVGVRKFFSEKVAEGYQIKLIDPARPQDELTVAYS